MRPYIDIVSEHAHDEIHKAELEKTGFWGAAGAGCIFLSRSTHRILLCHRSKDVEQPNTWGNWGGAIDPGESPDEAVAREATEESGHPGPFETIPLLVFRKGSFSYFNYLVVVDDEFTPTPPSDANWETQGHRWCEWGQWPSPLHFGLQSLFNDPESVAKIETEIEENRALSESSGAGGDMGAGVIFLARSTGRIGINQRSDDGTWGNWGGMSLTGETPIQTATREAREESGYQGTGILYPLDVSTDNGFTYHNFLAVIEDEFDVTLSDESLAYQWCEIGDWPAPLHFGLQGLFDDATVMNKIKGQI